MRFSDGIDPALAAALLRVHKVWEQALSEHHDWTMGAVLVRSATGDGLEQQLLQVLRIMEEDSILVPAEFVYVELGHGLSQLEDRPVAQALLNDAGAGLFQQVGVTDWSRLSRSAEVAAALAQRLINCRVCLSDNVKSSCQFFPAR